MCDHIYTQVLFKELELSSAKKTHFKYFPLKLYV